MIGVNTNHSDPKKLKEIMEKEKLNWRSMGSRELTIKWNAATPGYYVLDHHGVILFAANDGVSGRELWRTDGTSSGTWLVHDVRAGAAGSDPREVVSAGQHAFFVADDGVQMLPLVLLGVALVVIGLGGAGLLRVYVRDQSHRARTADIQRLHAERQERDVKQVNSANQAAILRRGTGLPGCARSTRRTPTA